MSDGRVVIDITGDASRYEKEVQELGRRTQQNLSSLSGALSTAGGALSKYITVPAIGAASAVGTIFAVKGWNRLEAIDTAKSKLKGLGYTAGDIESIMNSALDSVRGTAYGLGDAATVAVGALASGVNKGDDLTRVLRTIGDVATIAGGDFQGVASIFNKVLAKGKLQGDEILQLSEAGVPVLQILAQHLGTTAEEVSKLASKGEIGFSTFEEAMRNAFGGAALASGESMRGTIENTWAAVSRVGAAFLEGGESGQGFFNILKPLLTELTGDIDGMSETAGEWGAAFGDVVLAGVDGLRELAAAFNSLYPFQKRQVVQLAAVAVAAGPVLKIGSKLVSGAGLLAGGLSKTAAVSNRVITASKALGSTYAKNLQAQSAYTRQVGNGATTFYKLNAATQTYTKTNASLKASLLSTTTGHKAQALAATAGGKAMDVAKVAARGLSTALKAVAPIAIVSGVIALVSWISDLAQKSATATAATEGLEAAASGASIAFNEETGAIESVGAAAQSVNIEKMAQEHADLARSITEANQSMAASTGMLTGYGDTVAALAGRTDLTEDEIASLKLAVEGVNDACGTTYTVAQDMDGAWQVMADGATVAKDAVLNLIDAQKAQMRAEVEAANYKSTYEQLTKDAETYASAQADVTSKQDALNAKLEELESSGYDRYWTDQAGNVHDWAQAEQDALNTAQEALSEAEGQMGATQSAANRLEEQMKLTAMASAEGASEIFKLVDSNLQVKAAVQQTDTDLVAFTQALQDMGFTTEQVAAMTPEQAAAMAQGWQSGTQDMISACEELGIAVPETLQAMGEQAKAEAEKNGHDIGAGIASGLSAETEAIIGAALTVTGMTREQFDKLAAEAGAEGDEAVSAFAESIAAGAFPSQAAGKLNATFSGRGLGSVSGTDPGNKQAGQYYKALGSPSNMNASKRSGKADAQAGYEGISSKNRDFRKSGKHAGGNFASGLGAMVDAAARAARSVAGAVASILQFSVPKKGPFSGAEQGGKRSGMHLVQNIAAGMLAASRTNLKDATVATVGVLEGGIERAIDRLTAPTLEIPASVVLTPESLQALSGFSFSAAMEDRSGRDKGFPEAKVDLSPLTDALGRIEERIERATEKNEEIHRLPVKLDLSKRELKRKIKECL